VKTTPMDKKNHSPLFATRIKKISSENKVTKTLILDHKIKAQPGQFLMVWLPGIGEKPYSLVWDDPITLTVVNVGSFSEAIQQLSIGDRLWVRGPLGRGFKLKGDRILLVGGGYGAAPLLFLGRNAVQKAICIDTCLGARTAEDLILTSAFKEMGFPMHISTEDGSKGYKGLVTDLATQIIQKNQPDGLYACGPVAMLEKLKLFSEGCGIPFQLSWEAHIRCGIGICGSCELKRNGKESGWLVCRDGPVSINK
jgi:dihydroorotate dehydrogenase electron transfer subunit